MIQEITTQAFDEMTGDGPMMLEFYSKTCGPCKMLAFVLKDIDKTMPEFPIFTVDFDENPELKERLEVKGFPTMIFMKDKEEVSRLTGLKQKTAVIKAIEEIQS